MAQAIIHHCTINLLHCLSILLVLLVVQATTVTPTDRGFTVELIHRYSERSPFYDGNLTQSQIMQRLIEQSRSRVQWLESATSLGANITTLRPLLETNGYIYLVPVSIGTGQGKKDYHLQLDTGSRLMWTPCEPCDPCFRQPNQRFDPRRSSTYQPLPGNHHLCARPYKPDRSGKCTYKVVYGDLSSSQGILSQDTFTFKSDRRGRFETVGGVVFGCAHSAALSGPEDRRIDGVMGMGNGPFSLPAQLGGDGRFSYCLVPEVRGVRNSGFLQFGSSIIHQMGAIQSTPIIMYNNLPNYYFILKGVSINDQRLNLPPETFVVRRGGVGGCIIDTGATLTHLIQPAYDEVRKALVGLFTDLQLTQVPPRGGLELCYRLPANFQDLLPHMILHFKGADFYIGKDRLFLYRDAAFCWAMLPSEYITSLGVQQQYHIRFLYDIPGRKLSFAQENCTPESHR